MSRVTTVRDIDWIKHSFMLAGERIETNKDLVRYRNLSPADFKYEGTGFGESIVINPAPQMTPWADIRKQGLWTGSTGGVNSKDTVSTYFVGVGRAYTEMFIENRQTVHIRFGVTQYNGLLTFFTGFYDNNSAILARQGRASLSYYFGYLTGALATLWLAPIILAGTGLRYILGRTSSKYMTLKPTMPLYWERVTVIMNNIGAQLGIIPRAFSNTGAFNGNNKAFGVQDQNGNNVASGGVKDLEDLRNGQDSEDYKQHLHRIMPDLFHTDGTLNVLGGVLGGARRQIEWNNRITNLATMMGSTSSKSTYDAMIDYLSQPLNGTSSSNYKLFDYLKEYHGGVVGSLKDKSLDGDTVGDTLEAAAATGDTATLQQLGSASSTTNQEGSLTSDAAASITGDGVSATNSSFLSATAGSVAQPSSATQQSQSTSSASVTGIDEAGLNSQLNKPRDQEMLTMVKPTGTALTAEESAQLQQDIQNGGESNVLEKAYKVVTGWLTTAADTFETEWNNGSAFLNLAVNYTGSGSMSINNSTKETMISSTLKNTSATARDSRISLSDFNTGLGFIDAGLQAVRNVFAGALDSVSMSGFMALAGNAFIDIPKQWDDSTATVPTANFTIELVDPSGNKISNYLNQYMTIACLLAGATPLSTGTQSYTSPFVCEAYCQGHFAIRYGMITQLTVRHGTGNLGYSSVDKRPLAFAIDVEIADFSSVYHASISNGMSPLNIFKRVFDDDNIFNDYLSTITGMQLEDMVMPKRKLAIRFATQIKNVQSWWAPEHIASRMAGSSPIQTLNKLFGPTSFPGT